MKHESLRQAVCAANKELFATGLALLTFGNASGADREAKVMAIKPSGVDYTAMGPEDMVVLDLTSGDTVDGSHRPSSDTATHLALYRGFPEIGGVVHTHSRFATVFAQARMPIPCMGTTHADYFHGPVPITRYLKKGEVVQEYEANTGRLIVEHFEKNSLDPTEFPGVLVAGHGPFTWGKNVEKALDHARVLEEVARMTFETWVLRPIKGPLPKYLLDKHYYRKHGADAYYGQR
jgi:L-ribulose-5-phosphate 4-epimerase